jgi:hypothetical protein
MSGYSSDNVGEVDRKVTSVLPAGSASSAPVLRSGLSDPQQAGVATLVPARSEVKPSATVAITSSRSGVTVAASQSLSSALPILATPSATAARSSSATKIAKAHSAVSDKIEAETSSEGKEEKKATSQQASNLSISGDAKRSDKVIDEDNSLGEGLSLLAMFPKNPIATALAAPIRETGDYKKRATLEKTGAGVVFQVLCSMYRAFHLTFETSIEFQLHSEDLAYGIFDDLVVITPTLTQAYQYKCRLRGEEKAALSHFITKGGSSKKLTLHAYFDSVYSRLKINPADDKKGAEAVTPQKNETFFLASNQPLPQELIKQLDGDGRLLKKFFESDKQGRPQEKFLYGLIVASINNFKKCGIKIKYELNASQLADFLTWYLSLEKKYTDRLKKEISALLEKEMPDGKLNKYVPEVYIAIFLAEIKKGKIALIEKNFEEFEKILKKIGLFHKTKISIYDIAAAFYAPKIGKIGIFLQNIRFNFNSLNTQQLKKELQEKIKARFHVSSDVILMSFYKYFQAWVYEKTGTSLNRAKIWNLFERWKNNYIHLERLRGLTKTNLAKIASANHYFDRPKELEKIDEFVKDKDKSIFLLIGEAGIGKSCLVKKYIDRDEAIKFSFLFVDIREFYELIHQHLTRGDDSLALKYFEDIQVIFIDNAELATYSKRLRDFLLTLISQIGDSQIKLVFLSRNTVIDPKITEKIEDISLSCHIKPLPLEQILKQYPSLETPIFEDKLNATYGAADLEPMGNSAAEVKVEKSGLVEKFSGYKGIIHLLTIPFYLNLILRHSQALSAEISNFNAGDKDLRKFILTLVIEQRGQPKSGLSIRDLNTLRVSVLRKLLYAKNKESQQFFSRSLSKTEQEVLNDLVAEGILIKVDQEEGAVFQFDHLLYEEWVADGIVRGRLTATLEADDDLANLFSDLQRCLPKMQYFFNRILQSSASLETYLQHKFADQYLPEANNLDVLLRAAIATHHHQLFKYIFPFISSFRESLPQWRRLLLTTEKPNWLNYKGDCIFVMDDFDLNFGYAYFSIYYIDNAGKNHYIYIEPEYSGAYCGSDAAVMMAENADRNIRLLKNILPFDQLSSIREILAGLMAFTPEQQPITFLGDAIAAGNIEAAESLLEVIDAEAPEERPIDDGEHWELSDDEESYWGVYKDRGVMQHDEYKLVPHKNLEEGRRDPPASRLSSEDPEYVPYPKNDSFLHRMFFYFFKARNTGNQAMMNLIMSHIDKNIRSKQRESVMHLAVLSQDISLIEFLLAHNFPTDWTDADDETPLHNAIYCSRFFEKYAHVMDRDIVYDEEDIRCYQIFDSLLKKYEQELLSLHKKNKFGWSALHLAILRRDPIMISALVRAGALHSIEGCDSFYLMDESPHEGLINELPENSFAFSKNPVEVYYQGYTNTPLLKINFPNLKNVLIKIGVFDMFGATKEKEIELTAEQLKNLKKIVYEYADITTSKDRQGYTPEELIVRINRDRTENKSCCGSLNLFEDMPIPKPAGLGSSTAKMNIPAATPASVVVAAAPNAARSSFFSSLSSTSSSSFQSASKERLPSSAAPPSTLDMSEAAEESKTPKDASTKRKQPDSSSADGYNAHSTVTSSSAGFSTDSNKLGKKSRTSRVSSSSSADPLSLSDYNYTEKDYSACNSRTNSMSSSSSHATTTSPPPALSILSSLPRVSLYRPEDKNAGAIQSALAAVFEEKSAYTKGDCFFDSVAQGLEVVAKTIPGAANQEGYKKLRVLCNDYIKQHNRLLEEKNWPKIAMDKDAEMGASTYQDCLATSQYTRLEMIEKDRKTKETGRIFRIMRKLPNGAGLKDCYIYINDENDTTTRGLHYFDNEGNVRSVFIPDDKAEKFHADIMSKMHNSKSKHLDDAEIEKLFTTNDVVRLDGFFGGIAIWGRPDIEGIIICERLGVKLHIVEFAEHDGGITVGHRLVNPTNTLKTKEVEAADIDLTSREIIHIAAYQGHYTPIFSRQLMLGNVQGTSMDRIASQAPMEAKARSATLTKLATPTRANTTTPNRNNSPSTSSSSHSLVENLGRSLSAVTSSSSSAAVTAANVLVKPLLSPESLQRRYAELTEQKGILEGLIDNGEIGYINELKEIDRQRTEILEKMRPLGLVTDASIRSVTSSESFSSSK